MNQAIRNNPQKTAIPTRMYDAAVGGMWCERYHSPFPPGRISGVDYPDGGCLEVGVKVIGHAGPQDSALSFDGYLVVAAIQGIIRGCYHCDSVALAAMAVKEFESRAWTGEIPAWSIAPGQYEEMEALEDSDEVAPASPEESTD